MQMLKCTQCGAGIPLSANKGEVQCGFCGSLYEVVRKHSNGKPSPSQLGWFIGGVVVGFLIGWPASRAVAAATAKVSMAELERRIREWGERR